jgi:hypothetical protein
MTFFEQRRRNARWLIGGCIIVALVGVVFIQRHLLLKEPASVIPLEKELVFNPESGSAFAFSEIQNAWRAMRSDNRAYYLPQLQRSLEAISVRDRAMTIMRFLDTGADARSGGTFKIGPNGYLSDFPSLRVFLLDYLGRVDPMAAGQYAKKVLTTAQSPDEWAVALRNLATVNDTNEGRALIMDKLKEMWRNESWVNEASVGFLEAFDIAVHVGATNLVEPLSNLVRTRENRPISHAAFLALDRLVIQRPNDVLRILQEQPGLMEGREVTRANFFARADVADLSQLNLLQEYLLDSSRTESELNTFANLFPNANYMISHNLLTKTSTPDSTALALRDSNSLRIVESWLNEPRFAGVSPSLRVIQQRLQSFVSRAENRR